MIALIGILINDSIVFLDTYNRNILDGMGVRAAAIDAAKASVRKVEEYLTRIGIKTNVAKSSYMIFGKNTECEFELEINNEVLTRKKVFKYLGLRFNDQMSIDPQIRYLVNTRFLKHRGLVNAIMYTKNRLNLIIHTPYGKSRSVYHTGLSISLHVKKTDHFEY